MSDRWAETAWWTHAGTPELAGHDSAALDELAARVPDLVRGDRLVHTDLHGLQFLIDGDRVAVIDWGLPGQGAPWVDTAFMVLRLFEAGHTPSAAEAWARERSTWSGDAEGALTPWAVFIAGLWSHWATVGRSPQHRADLARGFAEYRLR
ncbi:phosphotransferase [Actinokineospora auranticolor]|uniref:phosphotransferase n=1 Tax=Actinokineospora auranticolor TaxID=155976 RepID=UPI001FEA4B03|nr:phosphotransferase [Actinokineospora auranticolor]